MRAKAVDFCGKRVYDNSRQVNTHLSAVCAAEVQTENRASGVNPERYRHCERGDRVQDESRPLGRPEKAVHESVKRKSGDLLKCQRFELSMVEG